MSSVSLTHPPTRPSPTSRRRSPPKRRPIPTKKKLGVLFWICVGLIVLVALLATFASLLPLPNPDLGNYNSVQNGGPGWGHLLGTDDLYRDIFSRLIYGARVSLVVGFGGALIGLVVGGIPAMFSAYRRGRIDTALNTGSYVVLAFPAIVAVIAIVSFWGTSLFKITLVIGLVRRAADLPGGPGLDPVLRHPGLRAGGQGARRQRHAHPRPRDPAQHHADHRLLRPDRRGHHHRAGGLAGLPRALGASRRRRAGATCSTRGRAC